MDGKSGKEIMMMKAKKPAVYEDRQDVISGSEQTGLIPALPADDEAQESYEEIYPIHEPREKTDIDKKKH